MDSSGDPVVLWSLPVHGREVRCARLRSGGGFELRVLVGDEVYLSQAVDTEAAAAAQAGRLRATLEATMERRARARAMRPPAAPAAAREGGQEEAAARAADPVPERGGAFGRPTVLIVDDEDAVRSFLRAYLEDADFDVREAADIDSALGMLDESPVDAVVLDVRMPDPRRLRRSGLEVLAFIRLHAAYAATPVLILTGRPLEAAEMDVIRRHRAHLFLKPDGYRKLLRRLEQLTGRRPDPRT